MELLLVHGYWPICSPTRDSRSENMRRGTAALTSFDWKYMGSNEKSTGETWNYSSYCTWNYGKYTVPILPTIAGGIHYLCFVSSRTQLLK